jgi:hypothetical protein
MNRALGRIEKTQQRRRSKIEIKQICSLLVKQIANAFGVHPTIIMFPEYEEQKIKKRCSTILFQDRGRIKLLTIF